MSSPGTSLAYTSEHQSLAMLEYFVHLDPADSPEDLVLATAEVPDSLSCRRDEMAALPSDWGRKVPAPPELTKIGDEFAKKAEKCLLFVPSALAVSENNVLINPQHHEFKLITVKKTGPLEYDSRMFRKTARRRKH